MHDKIYNVVGTMNVSKENRVAKEIDKESDVDALQE